MANASVTLRAERLRAAANNAQNIAQLAGVIDEMLARASRDVLVLAAAARGLAERLEREADAQEVVL